MTHTEWSRLLWIQPRSKRSPFRGTWQPAEHSMNCSLRAFQKDTNSNCRSQNMNGGLSSCIARRLTWVREEPGTCALALQAILFAAIRREIAQWNALELHFQCFHYCLLIKSTCPMFLDRMKTYTPTSQTVSLSIVFCSIARYLISPVVCASVYQTENRRYPWPNVPDD